MFDNWYLVIGYCLVIACRPARQGIWLLVILFIDMSSKINLKVKQLVIERIKASSPRLKVSAGNQIFTRRQMIESVAKGDKLGQTIIKTHLRFLRDLAGGKIYH